MNNIKDKCLFFEMYIIVLNKQTNKNRYPQYLCCCTHKNENLYVISDLIYVNTLRYRLKHFMKFSYFRTYGGVSAVRGLSMKIHLNTRETETPTTETYSIVHL